MATVTGPYRDFPGTGDIDPLDTESLAKTLAIKLAVSELEKIKSEFAGDQGFLAADVIKNLLIGLGCQEVVDAREECT